MIQLTFKRLAVLVLVLAAVSGVGCLKKKGPDPNQPKIDQAGTEVSVFKAALMIYMTDNGKLPTKSQGLQALVVQPPNTPDWKGPYFNGAIPKDPWGRPYVYRVPGTRSPDDRFDIYSVGPDGIDGNIDDIGNWEKK